MIRRVEVLAALAVRVERDGRTLEEAALDALGAALDVARVAVRRRRVEAWLRSLRPLSALGRGCPAGVPGCECSTMTRGALPPPWGCASCALLEGAAP